MNASTAQQRWVSDALETLGVDVLALIVFDSALPQDERFDTGAGSPYSALAHDFFAFVRGLGFTAVQFGPQGAVTRFNASPYDGTAFSRNPLALALDRLASTRPNPDAPLRTEQVEALLQPRPPDLETRVPHSHAFDALSHVLASPAWVNSAERQPGFSSFVSEHQWWLEADALYQALCAYHGVGDHSRWPRDQNLWAHPRDLLPVWSAGVKPASSVAARLNALCRQFRAAIRHYAATQYWVHDQHAKLLEYGRALRLSFFGDLQVGYSRTDTWHFQSTFLNDYALGAPPSRTNPEGQPWGYPVLDPAQFTRPDGSLGPALALLDARAAKQFEEYHRVRIDHPHGIVCPWVYKTGTADDLRAVQMGARLFSSPALPDHPALDSFSRVSSQDIDPRKPRSHDGWVTRLSPAELDAFCVGMDVLARHACAAGGYDRLICEVLSTQPYELGAVLDRYGLGRFRVTQKAKLEDPRDVYRSENARPEDWVLIGNHDTPTLQQTVTRWRQTDEYPARAEYLARRLSRTEAERGELATHLCSAPSELMHAALADLFACPARHVVLSFTDLFGYDQPYNTPGFISNHNWSLRIPRNFRDFYQSQLNAGAGLCLQRALRMALQARAPESPLLR